MIDLFGRLPVHERQYIQHVVAVPGGGSAYMASAVAVYQGPVKVQAVGELFCISDPPLGLETPANLATGLPARDNACSRFL